MRTRNVAALAELLREAGTASSGGYRLTSHCVEGDPVRPIYSDPARLAEWLVEAAGVLVPGAVTDQEAMDLLHKVPAELHARVPDGAEGPWLREGMRRIASDGPAGAHDGPAEELLCLKGTHHWGHAPA